MNYSMPLTQDINNFDYSSTKKNVNNYFASLEELKWEQAKLSAQKGLTTNYEFTPENKKQNFIKIGKDEFNLSALEDKDGEIQKHLSGFH